MTAAPERIPLSPSFFDRPVLRIAPDLPGRILVRATADGPIELRTYVCFTYGMSGRSA